MARKHDDDSGSERRLHTYIVKAGNDQQQQPLTLQAESFEVDKDTITFTTGGQTSAVVRGGWTSVVQTPDPEGA